MTPYAQAMTDDAERFHCWRHFWFPNETWRPEMLAEYRTDYGEWNPHGHRPHGQREWK